eukprot:1398143-Amphidinium_carterae.1
MLPVALSTALGAPTCSQSGSSAPLPVLSLHAHQPQRDHYSDLIPFWARFLNERSLSDLSTRHFQPARP